MKWTTAPNARLNLLRKNICVRNAMNHITNGCVSYPNQNKTAISGTRCTRVGIIMSKQVRTKINGVYVYGELIGVFQFAEPFTPMLRGQTAGQISYPVAVIDTLEHGFVEVRASRVERAESVPSE